jgi:hypothetical protein
VPSLLCHEQFNEASLSGIFSSTNTKKYKNIDRLLNT